MNSSVPCTITRTTHAIITTRQDKTSNWLDHKSCKVPQRFSKSHCARVSKNPSRNIKIAARSQTLIFIFHILVFLVSRHCNLTLVNQQKQRKIEAAFPHKIRQKSLNFETWLRIATGNNWQKINSVTNTYYINNKHLTDNTKSQNTRPSFIAHLHKYKKQKTPPRVSIIFQEKPSLLTYCNRNEPCPEKPDSIISSCDAPACLSEKPACGNLRTSGANWLDFGQKFALGPRF